MVGGKGTADMGCIFGSLRFTLRHFGNGRQGFHLSQTALSHMNPTSTPARKDVLKTYPQQLIYMYLPTHDTMNVVSYFHAASGHLVSTELDLLPDRCRAFGTN